MPGPGTLDPDYRWLAQEPGPRMLIEALALHGTHEAPGERDNPDILGWAAELGGEVAKVYTHDSVAWCGLFVAIAAKRAFWPVVDRPLWAANWLKWGVEVATPMLGDILVFTRPGGNHVGFYVGEDATHFHVLGGNQTDQVNVVRIAKSRLRLRGARRAPWRAMQPPNVRRILLAPSGRVSTNEA